MKIKGHDVEFFDEKHIYLVDGVITPSITQVLNVRFHSKYDGVDSKLLMNAQKLGTELHHAIYDLCVNGTESDLIEIRNFKFLQRAYKFEVICNEVPVLLLDNDIPVAAGRLDLVLQDDTGRIGGADIKRTASLDKDYLFYQLNLYRLAYMSSYGVEWEFLRGIWLRDTTRKYVEIPIDEMAAWEIMNQYKEANA